LSGYKKPSEYAGGLNFDHIGEERFELSTSCPQSRLLDFVKSLILFIVQADVTELNLGQRQLGTSDYRFGMVV